MGEVGEGRAAFPWPVGDGELAEACAEYLEGLGNAYDPSVRAVAARAGRG